MRNTKNVPVNLVFITDTLFQDRPLGRLELGWLTDALALNFFEERNLQVIEIVRLDAFGNER